MTYTQQFLNATCDRLLFEVVMRLGDVLYLPRGQYHDALTGAQALRADLERLLQAGILVATEIC